jgi:hypothetical protein
VVVGSWGSESEAQRFELGQRGQTTGHRLRRNVPGVGDTPKVKMDQVAGSGPKQRREHRKRDVVQPQRPQTGRLPTQKRIGEDCWHEFRLGSKHERRQSRKRLVVLRRSRQPFELRTRDAVEADFAYAIAVLERDDDVVVPAIASGNGGGQSGVVIVVPYVYR